MTPFEPVLQKLSVKLWGRLPPEAILYDIYGKQLLAATVPIDQV
jgi:hypothetical protein